MTERQFSYPATARVSPLTIQIAFGYHVSPDLPHQFLGEKIWNCGPAEEARRWLLEQGMIQPAGAGHEATDKLAAWVYFICATPVPVREWRLPAREPGGKG